MHRDAQRLPLFLIAWACLGIALNVGLERFTYGVMLPALRVDLGLDYLASGSLNTIHLGGYLVGTLAAPMWGRRFGIRGLAVQSHLLVALGAGLCAVAPSTRGLGMVMLGAGRLTTGLGAGVGIVAIFVTVFAAVSAARRPLVPDVRGRLYRFRNICRYPSRRSASLNPYCDHHLDAVWLRYHRGRCVYRAYPRLGVLAGFCAYPRALGGSNRCLDCERGCGTRRSDGAVLVGLGLAATPTIVTSQVRNRCSAEDYPRAFSFASAAPGIGQVIGPVAAGALADRFGTAAVPLFAASAYGLAVLFAIADTIRVRPQPAA
ncbi:MAG: YbfB/YjiJ family MFS transporter [Pseudolabrys sp.]